MVGLGPLEPLLLDDTINDILVNGPEHVFVERKGMLEQVPVRFRDWEHLTNICQRIAASVGRHVDEGSPMGLRVPSDETVPGLRHARLYVPNACGLAGLPL